MRTYMMLALVAAVSSVSIGSHELLARSSPASLAFVGDAVFELAVRERLLWPPAKIADLRSCVQRVVCAETQDVLLKRLIADFGLTDDEHEWLRRGRNASGRGPRRVDRATYQSASALETLIGVLHLTDRERLQSLLGFVLDSVEPILEGKDQPSDAQWTTG